MKKVLIFYACYGGGHLSAARSIKECIEANYPDVETNLVDCIKYVNKSLNKITTSAYSEMAKKLPWAWAKLYSCSQSGPIAAFSSGSNKLMSVKLNKLLQEYQPDLIISTHFFASQMCSILKQKGKLHAKLSTIMTDYAPHEQWLMNSDYVDYFFVAHDGMKEAIIQKGIPAKKVYATGIPLSNRFLQNYNKEEILKEFHLQPNKKTILFFAGGEFGLGKSTTYDMLKAITENFDNLQVVAIAGKNEKMKRSFEYLVEQSHKEDSVKVLEYTTKVPELMSVSDLVITKPGGLTTTESLASGLPIIVMNPIPGQEEENSDFLESHHVAIRIKKNDNATEILKDLFSSSTKMQEMKVNARLLAKKNSSKDICEILLSSIESTHI